jgi:ribosome modulation factor
MNEAYYKFAKNLIDTVSTDELEKALSNAGFIVTRRDLASEPSPTPQRLNTSAFEEGERAQRNGDDRTSVPYEDQELRYEWLAGFYYANQLVGHLDGKPVFFGTVLCGTDGTEFEVMHYHAPDLHLCTWPGMEKSVQPVLELEHDLVRGNSAGCVKAVWEDDIGNAGDTFTRCKTCGTYQGNPCRLRATADVVHTVWLKPTDAAIFDLYDTSEAGQDFQVSASSQKTSTHTVPFVRGTAAIATPAGGGECATCCGVGYFVKNKRSGERIESACVSCNGSGASSNPTNAIAAQPSVNIPTSDQSITFAHEIDGPWRLELNGVTISRHDKRDDLELAIEALRAALARRPTPGTTDGTQQFSNKEGAK